MKKIEIDDDVFKYILSNIEDFGESPSDILRRLLISNDKNALNEKPLVKPIKAVTNQTDLSESNNTAAKVISKQTKNKIKPTKKITAVKKKTVPRKKRTPSTIFKSEHVPDVLANGIDFLYESNALQKEHLIVNKFKMILTALYLENSELFIKASKQTKGSTRAYIGENLQALLSSSNEEEVAVLVASKPRDIPYTPLWVVTHTNSARKRIILALLMAEMGYSSTLIEQINAAI